nr:reverse transcriptase domain-containing protein [Pseudomonas putida]
MRPLPILSGTCRRIFTSYGIECRRGLISRRRSRLLRYRRHRGYTQAGSAYGQRPYRTNCSQTPHRAEAGCAFPSGLIWIPTRAFSQQAIAITRERCWRYDWVVEFDIKAAFDHIDHELLMKAVRTHIKEDWILLYIERWLVAPFEAADGVRIQRERGTPQGGVISPMLMNLFMHYTFDAWMQRNSPNCPFARYADDAVVHCRSERQAEHVMRSIASRLAVCGLTMHPEKSKIVYCKDSNRRAEYPHVSFTFLGFTFRPRKAIGQQNNLFTSFLPGVSAQALKRMRRAVREWRVNRQTHVTLAAVARLYNPVIQGWWQYYGAFYRTAMLGIFRHIDSALKRWAGRKYKILHGRKRRISQWLDTVQTAAPRLFYHWQVTEQQVG